MSQAARRMDAAVTIALAEVLCFFGLGQALNTVGIAQNFESKNRHGCRFLPTPPILSGGKEKLCLNLA
jgi:hypothetical protein